jgi:putative tryptophan/tyrosine transport system substrate-binding protein
LCGRYLRTQPALESWTRATQRSHASTAPASGRYIDSRAAVLATTRTATVSTAITRWELMSNAAVFGVLADPAIPGIRSTIADLQAAARTLGLQLVVVNARTDGDLETAFATFSQQRVGAVFVGLLPLYPGRMEQLAALAARYALPAIFHYREFALAGGLMSYGSSLGYMNHQAGIYTGRILKGEKPADLPVQQVTKIELILNLKAAKALGLTIPETLLATAEEVIQ